MIQFESIHLDNFAIFTDITIPFSTDQQRPLTLLRGENESGKTTLMRAFVWALFGNESLPRMPETRHPVRPVWGKIGEHITTRVEVKFRSDDERGPSQFKLSRSLETMDDGATVAATDEQVSLLRRDGDDWTEQDDQLQLLLKQFFRKEMRDFFFIDADKAVDFVGGPEGRHSDKLMREAATQAVRALLGLDVMLKAKERLEDRQINFSRQAGSQSTDDEKRRLANDLTEAQNALDAAKVQLQELTAEEKDRDDAYRAVKQEFENQISKLEELSETNARYDSISQELATLRLRQREVVNDLGQKVDDERLFTALMLAAIDAVMAALQPLKEKGYIPPTELTLLPRLIERGECVCGIDLKENEMRRHHVEAQIERAEQTRERSQFLDLALESARGFANRAFAGQDRGWRDDVEAATKELAELDPRISRLADDIEHLRDERARAGTGAALKELQKHQDELQHQYEDAARRRNAVAEKVESLQKQTRSLSEQIRTGATAEKRTQVARVSAQVAEDLGLIVADACDSIEREQVLDVSGAMDRIFRDVITATNDSLFQEVGIRKVPSDRSADQYEVYAIEGGREKPLALANGASRRAIGVAFILALAQETRTKVPLVADSLL